MKCDKAIINSNSNSTRSGHKKKKNQSLNTTRQGNNKETTKFNNVIPHKIFKFNNIIKTTNLLVR